MSCGIGIQINTWSNLILLLIFINNNKMLIKRCSTAPVIYRNVVPCTQKCTFFFKVSNAGDLNKMISVPTVISVANILWIVRTNNQNQRKLYNQRNYSILRRSESKRVVSLSTTGKFWGMKKKVANKFTRSVRRACIKNNCIGRDFSQKLEGHNEVRERENGAPNTYLSRSND